jgi:aminoglycoside phosphotransferase
VDAVLEVSIRQADEILRQAGEPGGVRHVEAIKRRHDVFQITTDLSVYYLKAHSKDLDAGRDPLLEAAAKVRREHAAYTCLNRHGRPAVDVVTVDPGADNELGWPYLVTRPLAGIRLLDIVRSADAGIWPAAVRTFGEYLASAHEIIFAHCGYLVSADGPAPDGSSIAAHEPTHHAAAVSAAALRDLERARPHLDLALATKVEARFDELPRMVATEYTPPRFVHGNIHLDHPYLLLSPGGAKFEAYLDMDAASAGAVAADIESVAWEMMLHGGGLRWWEPFFDGYGRWLDLDRVRVGLLTACFYCFGEETAFQPIDATYRNLLAARSWDELFTANRSR